MELTPFLEQGPPPPYDDIEAVPSAPMMPRGFGEVQGMAPTRRMPQHVRASRASLTSTSRSTLPVRSSRSRSGSRAGGHHDRHRRPSGGMTPALRKEEPLLR